MVETKRFPLRTVLTVTTGRLLTKPEGPRDNGIGDLYKLLGWMTDDSPFTHQLPRFGKECEPWLLKWFPDMAKATDALPQLDSLMELKGNETGIELWLEALIAGGQPEYLDIPRIPKGEHVKRNPLEELTDMVGADRVVVVAS